MPGLADTDPDPNPPPVTCPCLDALAETNDYDWGMVTFCTHDPVGFDFGLFINDFVQDPDNPELVYYNFTSEFATDSDGETAFCTIRQSSGVDISFPTSLGDSETLGEYDVCLSELLSRCSG